MIMINRLKLASRVYFDSNILIYLIERTDLLQQKIVQVLNILEQTEASLFISNIGVAECFFGAHKFKNDKLIQQYHDIFYDNGLFNLVPVDSERVISAARLGAEKNLKLVDATHFLAAIEMECEVFLTNDHHFKSSHGVAVLQIDEL